MREPLKRARWQARRTLQAWRWGRSLQDSLPVVFGNAMAKAGSHLIVQVLEGLTGIGPFVNPGMPPVNRGDDNSKLAEETILANLRRLRPGDIAYGYLSAREPYLSILTRPQMASIFVYRDPRDLVVSHVYYMTEMNTRHAMHAYYRDSLPDTEARIAATIQGIEAPGMRFSGIASRYESYLGWLAWPDVLCLRFEDLILEQEQALARLLDFLAMRGLPHPPMARSIEVLRRSVDPARSGTYRKASPGNWREHFSPANRALFKEAAGDLLIRLGYESNHDW